MHTGNDLPRGATGDNRCGKARTSRLGGGCSGYSLNFPTNRMVPMTP